MTTKTGMDLTQFTQSPNDVVLAYVVRDENCLGYLFNNSNGSMMLGIWASSVIRGGPDPLNGPFYVDVTEGPRFRVATQKDFDEYRVCSTGLWKEENQMSTCTECGEKDKEIERLRQQKEDIANEVRKTIAKAVRESAALAGLVADQSWDSCAPYWGGRMLGEIERLKTIIAAQQKDIERLSRPWEVSIVYDGKLYDAEVVDIGHSDRVLVVELSSDLRDATALNCAREL